MLWGDLELPPFLNSYEGAYDKFKEMKEYNLNKNIDLNDFLNLLLLYFAKSIDPNVEFSNIEFDNWLEKYYSIIWNHGSFCIVLVELGYFRNEENYDLNGIYYKGATRDGIWCSEHDNYISLRSVINQIKN